MKAKLVKFDRGEEIQFCQRCFISWASYVICRRYVRKFYVCGRCLTKKERP